MIYISYQEPFQILKNVESTICRYLIKHSSNCECSTCRNPACRFLLFQAGCLQSRLKYLQSKNPAPDLFLDLVKYWKDHFNNGQIHNYSNDPEFRMMSLNLHIWHSQVIQVREALVVLESVKEMLISIDDHDLALKQDVLAQIAYLKSGAKVEGLQVTSGCSLNKRFKDCDSLAEKMESLKIDTASSAKTTKQIPTRYVRPFGHKPHTEGHTTTTSVFHDPIGIDSRVLSSSKTSVMVQIKSITNGNKVKKSSPKVQIYDDQETPENENSKSTAFINGAVNSGSSIKSTVTQPVQKTISSSAMMKPPTSTIVSKSTKTQTEIKADATKHQRPANKISTKTSGPISSLNTESPVEIAQIKVTKEKVKRSARPVAEENNQETPKIDETKSASSSKGPVNSAKSTTLKPLKKPSKTTDKEMGDPLKVANEKVKKSLLRTKIDEEDVTPKSVSGQGRKAQARAIATEKENTTGRTLRSRSALSK